MADAKDSPKKKIKRPTAKKRDLQNIKKNLLNRSFSAKVNTAIRSLKKSVSLKETGTIEQNLNVVYSLMDKGVKTGLFKINKASRVKARLYKQAHSK